MLCLSLSQLLGCVIFFPTSFYCLGTPFIVYLFTLNKVFIFIRGWQLTKMYLNSRWVTVTYPLFYFLMKYFFPLNHRNRCSNTTMQNLPLSSHFENKQSLVLLEKSTEPNSFTRKFIIKIVCISMLTFSYICLIKYIILYPNFSAPDSPPQDFSVKQLSGVTVKLSWQPPLEPNGIILYYTVYVW